jgi:hypothetical protein
VLNAGRSETAPAAWDGEELAPALCYFGCDAPDAAAVRSHHLRRLSARWDAANRTELVGRAYALGVLASGVWPPTPAASDWPE